MRNSVNKTLSWPLVPTASNAMHLLSALSVPSFDSVAKRVGSFESVLVEVGESLADTMAPLSRECPSLQQAFRTGEEMLAHVFKVNETPHFLLKPWEGLQNRMRYFQNM